MKLENILPQNLGASGYDCASIFNSLLMAAHSDRDRARALGWREVQLSSSEHPAWICRVAGSDLMFGIRFNGEQEYEATEHTPHCLRGNFSLFVFPPSESPLLDRFPLNALHFGLAPMYYDAVREFNGSEYFFQSFCLGQLRLDVSFEGDALALTLEAPARHRVIAVDGVEIENGWIVKPGQPECDVPSFSLFLRLFSVLTATTEQQLGEEARIARGLHFIPRMQFHSFGGLEECETEKEAMLNLTASFGPAMHMESEGLAPLRSLPLRNKTNYME